MLNFLLLVLAGHIAGWLCAIGGALKDSPHEGFKPLTFPRSIVVGTVGGVCAAILLHNAANEFLSAKTFLLAFAVAGYFERAAVEGWKIIRHRKPGKFDWTEPSRLTH
jgi:hypothetical protein